MTKITLTFACLFIFFTGCNNKQQKCEPQQRNKALASIDSLGTSLNWPADLQITGFSGPDLTPSPACLAVAATGEVFVGVDMIGSLGKKPGKGMIVRLVDCNNDGIMDSHTEYAQVDNPRGIISLGDRLFVLHTKFSEDSTASGMDLVVFEDKDHDGIADGAPKTLITHMSNITYLKSRGTDHATNGIRMGIDGWIYIAVGDFGFHEAVGSDGKKLTMLGGGIVRVRPDGTEMEIYTHGLRNIYDVAIDPYMNIFTRDNTNDGGGWNIRFSHQVQSGEYGYPVLWKNFTEEIIPALVDLGGGSGTGALFMDEPTWPNKYNNVPMMADWGRSELYIHRLTPAGGSFTQQQEDFIKLPQITDLDVDGSGRLYLSAWDGAGYSGDSSKGFVARAVPQNWKYTAFPDLKDASVSDLQSLLKSNSSVARLNAQQKLLTRPKDEATKAAWELAADKSLPLYARVAGIYTYAQIAKANGIKNLVQLTSDENIREFALRALADRKPFLKDVSIEPFLSALKDTSARVQIAAIVGLGRLGRVEAAKALLEIPVPNSFAAVPKGQEGPHATPNPEIIPAHLAVRALVALNAVDACIAAIDSAHSTLALWALRYMHEPKAVDGLIAAYQQSPDPELKRQVLSPELKKQVLSTLARLYNEEAPYDGTWWWGTRPDTHGPYYKPITWESSDKIKALLMQEWSKSSAAGKQYFADLNGKLRLGITQFGGDEEQPVEGNEVKVDFNKIKSKKGQIEKSSIEDIMLALDKIKGDPALGKKLFTQQGCFVCHSIKKGEVLKGPFMGQIGSIMNRQQIAESILKPSASISQGFATVQITTNDGKTLLGFVTAQSSDKVVLRDITGTAHTINTKDIKKREELKTSMMPTGLANALSYEEFASLVTFLSQQK
jgi:putative heme-binding domain-containing protein